MKICFLAGANSIHSHRWVNYFKNKGHEVYWLSLSPSTYPVEGVAFYEISNASAAPWSIFLSARKAKQIISQIKPDVLHVHSAGRYGLVNALVGFHPAVITAWGSDVLLVPPIRKPIVRFILSKADVLTCDGDNTTQALIKLGVPARKIKRVLFGTDVDKFKPEDNAPGLNNTVISLRSLEPVYNIETLVRAAAIVLKDNPQARFNILGDGSQKQYLAGLADSLGISQAIKFSGLVKNDELPGILRSAGIYVSVSLSDSGLAASTAEAMASGLPAIVTDTGDNRKWVEENKGGFVIPVKNPQILAEKIAYMLNNAQEMSKFGSFNRSIIEKNNNYYLEMKKMENIYQAMVKN